MRLASGADHVARYVCKYLAKPIAASYINRPDQLDEAMIAFTGRRVSQTFGTWHDLDLKLPDDSTVWRAIAPLADILTDAANGLDYAVRILALLKQKPDWTPTNPEPDPP